MKRLVALSLPAVAAVTLAACGGGSSSTTTSSADGGGGTATETTAATTAAPGGSGGSLTVGAASGIPQLNPVLKGTAFEEALFPLLWGGLSRLGPDGTVEPDLATRWTPSADNRRWTFELRDGVRFSNGKALTANDVVETLKYYQDPDTATQLKTALEPVKSVTADGRARVVFTLSRANVLLPEVLVPVKIVDVDSLRTIDREPAVTGPFTVSEFVPGDHVYLRRNADYWGDPAPLDEIRLVKAADSTSAVTSLRSGDLDALWSVPSSDIPQLRNEPEISIVEPDVTGVYVSWEMDLSSPPFDDLRARQALAYATDREAIFKAAYYDQGLVSATNTPLADNSPWFAEGMTDYSYDLDKARELFEQAGVRELTWWGVAGQYPEWNTSGQILQASLKKIGVDLKIENRELSSWPAKFYPAGRRYPGLVVPNFQSFAPDPYFQLSFLLRGRCECNWDSPEFSDLFDEAVATPDRDARKAVWDRAQRLINEQVPIIVPVQTTVATATQKDVVGVWVEGGGLPHFESAGFAE
ncbi:ABC transporter substrate-binding protein [Conexibacter stalactiti]|uniref:ABC transporter substrate-binding protein n=1 Tax=Conexibacter stalactiti TaxID=1940611 RepID=A0ABU4HYT8_9ACTN|nr:ABC transporter substrate-binding protein [Conexibacter stalactiti]MDW5598436.1 ABC transporter substrate-binding protein [Conexibacter stalactiti]MEC5039078.1 ABC transporter substrate-binding protein [Conexibacter stalactiti]